MKYKAQEAGEETKEIATGDKVTVDGLEGTAEVKTLWPEKDGVEVEFKSDRDGVPHTELKMVKAGQLKLSKAAPAPESRKLQVNDVVLIDAEEFNKDSRKHVVSIHPDGKKAVVASGDKTQEIEVARIRAINPENGQELK